MARSRSKSERRINPLTGLRPRLSTKENEMLSRNKYVVEYTNGKELEVYADKISITEPGQIIFYQLRKTAAIDEDGKRVSGELMTVVMILQSTVFNRVYSAPASGLPHYTEAGAVELIN